MWDLNYLIGRFDFHSRMESILMSCICNRSGSAFLQELVVWCRAGSVHRRHVEYNPMTSRDTANKPSCWHSALQKAHRKLERRRRRGVFILSLMSTLELNVSCLNLGAGQTIDVLDAIDNVAFVHHKIDKNLSNVEREQKVV